MSQILNAPSIVLALGVLQPATTFEIVGFLDTMLPNAGGLPTPDEILTFLKEREAAGHVIRVARREDGASLYSLTLAGHRYLSVSQRRLRDKLRFYLLRDAHRGRHRRLGGGATGLVGVSPTLDTSLVLKGSVANKFGQRVPSGQTYWPRIARQFDNRTGLSASSPDNMPEWLSLRNQQQCEIAGNFKVDQFELDYEGLATCLGVSPKIISQIANAPERHYRSFPIAKKGGGEREISSPRVFLKVVQWFLNDFVLNHLPVHHAVNSFKYGRSVLSNAMPHVGQPFVGSIDIEDYFGAIKPELVSRVLVDSGFRLREARLITALTTKSGAVPQGAPTSATLSNAVLFDFDDRVAKFCAHRGLIYTRYADDITISGATRDIVRVALRFAQGMLLRKGFHINQDKTRIASRGSQQSVTGVVVNCKAQPSRIMRRKIRAKFHNARISGEVTEKEISALRGSLSYLKMFPSFCETKQFYALESDLDHLLKVRVRSST